MKSAKDADGKFRQVPVLSTNDKLDHPDGWSKLITMEVPPPSDEANKVVRWMDFYVIFDGDIAHLFATSAGKLWRSQTRAADFPQGWSRPVVALSGNIVYASHTYRQETATGPRFLTTLTASADDPATKKKKQYQVSYVAQKLDGPWTPDQIQADAPF